jgi:glucokinase
MAQVNGPAAPLESLVGDGYVGAVDLGGTKILAVVVAPDGRIAGRAKKKSTSRGSDAAIVLDRIAECVREAASQAGIAPSEIRAIGVGVPGPVVRETGVVTAAVNLGWKDVPVRDELERRLGVPIGLDGDVRTAVLAEHRAGAGQGARNMVGIWPGTGIGGGVIINGAIVTGATNSAGEIGHMTIKAGGPLCACGGKGHLESLASRTAIAKWISGRVQKGDKTVLTTMVAGDVARATSGDLADAVAQGDKLAIKGIERAAKYLSIGIASVANLVNPELVVLGGGLVQALGEPFVRQIATQLNGRPMLAATRDLKVVMSQLGDDAGVIGGALIARWLTEGDSRDLAEAAVALPAVPASDG